MNNTITFLLKATKQYYPIFCYLIFASFSLFWFRGKEFISAGDFGWPIDFKVFFKLTTSVWDWSVAPGYNAARQVASIFPYALYGYVASLLGISSSYFERIIFFLSFFVSGYGFYLLAGKYTQSKFFSFIAGMMYMFSPYASIIVWNPSYGMTFPFYSFLPISLYWISNYSEAKGLVNKTLFKTLIFITVSFLGASYSNPVFFILFLAFSFFIVLTFTVSFRIFIKKYVLLTFLYTLINMFWLLPVAKSFDTQFVGAQNETAGLVSDSKTKYLNSVNFIDGLLEKGFWAFHAQDAGDNYYVFVAVLENPTYAVFATLFVIAVLVAFDYRNRRFLFVYGMLLCGIFLNSGLLLPFPIKNIANYFYELPFLGRALRSVFLKTGLISTFSLSLLVVYLLDRAKTKKLEKFVVVLLIALVLFRAYPFVTSQVIKPGGNILPSYAFNIPSDYYDMASYMNQRVKNEYVLTLPLPKSYNYVYRWRDGGYIGGDFFRTMSFIRNYYVNFGSPMIAEFARNYDFSILERLGIEYLLVHKDVPLYFDERYITSDFSKLINTLKQQRNIVEEYSTENLLLYKIEWNEPISLFNVSSSPLYIDNTSEETPLFAKMPKLGVSTSEIVDAASIYVGPKIIDHTMIETEVWNDGWAWPRTDISPSSYVYPFYRFKESVEGYFLQEDQDRINYLLWVTSKRANEICVYSATGKTLSRLEHDMINSLDKLKRVIADYRITALSSHDYLSMTNKVMRYIEKARGLIPVSSKTLVYIDDFQEWLIENTGYYCTSYCYSFEVPRPGNYSVEGINLSSGKLKFQVMKNEINKPVDVGVDEGVSLEMGDILYITFTEDLLKKRLLPSASTPNEDYTGIYSSSQFQYLRELDDGELVSVEPQVVSNYYEVADLEDIYSVVLEFRESGALLDLDVYEIGDFYQNSNSGATIADIFSKSPSRGVKNIIHEANISEHSYKKDSTMIFTKQFELSSNAKGVYLKLYIYSLPGKSNYTRINDFSLISREKFTPYLKLKVENNVSETVGIGYESISSTRYILDVPGGWPYIIFNAGFDPGWVIKYRGDALLKVKVDGYKNGFKLPINFEGGKLELIYSPEMGRDLGIYISIISASLIFVGMMFTSINKEKK